MPDNTPEGCGNAHHKKIDFKKPWKRMTMLQSIKKFAQIDIEKMSEKEYTHNKIEINQEYILVQQFI